MAKFTKKWLASMISKTVKICKIYGAILQKNTGKQKTIFENAQYVFLTNFVIQKLPPVWYYY